MKEPNSYQTNAWRNLMITSQRLVTHIEAELKKQRLPSLSLYDALWELEKAHPNGLRPYQLKARLLLAQYATSRLVDKLCALDYTVKKPDLEDGRGHLVFITNEGRRIRSEMWAVYSSVLSDIFNPTISKEDCQTLSDILIRLRNDEPSTP